MIATQTDDFGRLKVAASPGVYDVVTGNITAVGQDVRCDVTTASNVMLYCTGAFVGSNVVFEGSLDGGANWFSLQAVRSNANIVENTTGVLSGPSGYAWELSVNGLTHFRVKASAFTSGTQTWQIVRGAYATEPIPATQAHAVTQSGAWAVTDTPTAPSSFVLVSAASTNATLVKASPGMLYEVSISNVTGTACYVKLFNKASAPTVGTDVPSLTIPVAAGQAVGLEFGVLGKRFPVGIALAVTGAIAATDATAAIAGVQVHASYL